MEGCCLGTLVPPLQHFNSIGCKQDASVSANLHKALDSLPIGDVGQLVFTTSPTHLRSVPAFLADFGLQETETLNTTSLSGACQFASVAHQLWGRLCSPEFRPDVVLRQLAVGTITRNPGAYQAFLLDAGYRTRAQNAVGGDAVDMGRYLARMSDSRCDGDHVTLQALSDATGATINVIKWPPSVAEPYVCKPWTVVPREASPSGATAAIRAPARSIWLSLHGEAHYRSLALAATVPRGMSPEAPAVASDTPSAASDTEGCECEGAGAGGALPSAGGDCIICADEMPVVGRCRPYTCAHMFCVGCLSRWAQVSTTCPLCKQDFGQLCVLGPAPSTAVVETRDVATRRQQYLPSEDDFYEVVDADGNRHLAYNGYIAADLTSNCHVCDQAVDDDLLLLCDGRCGRSAHTYCMALGAVPDGDWFCDQCQLRRLNGTFGAHVSPPPRGGPAKRRRSLRMRGVPAPSPPPSPPALPPSPPPRRPLRHPVRRLSLPAATTASGPGFVRALDAALQDDARLRPRGTLMAAHSQVTPLLSALGGGRVACSGLDLLHSGAVDLLYRCLSAAAGSSPLLPPVARCAALQALADLPVAVDDVMHEPLRKLLRAVSGGGSWRDATAQRLAGTVLRRWTQVMRTASPVRQAPPAAARRTASRKRPAPAAPVAPPRAAGEGDTLRAAAGRYAEGLLYHALGRARGAVAAAVVRATVAAVVSRFERRQRRAPRPYPPPCVQRLSSEQTACLKELVRERLRTGIGQFLDRRR